MKLRELGNSGVRVSALGLGCMGLSSIYGKTDPEKARQTVDTAIERGLTYFDTADAYARGDNERFLGEVLQGRRDRVFLSSKFGFRFEPGGQVTVSGHPDYAIRACDASLERLRTDHLDLYYLHRVDPEVPIEDTVGAMQRLVEQGKILNIGICEASAQTIRRAVKAANVIVVQSEYSLWSRECEGEVLPTCRELGIGYVAYSPLGRGFLTGKIRSESDLEPDDPRHRHPRFQQPNVEKNKPLLEQLDRFAADKGCTPAQVALAWLLSRGEDIVPIPGTGNPQRLAENLGALSVNLTESEQDALSEIFRPGAFTGDRGPEFDMRYMEMT